MRTEQPDPKVRGDHLCWDCEHCIRNEYKSYYSDCRLSPYEAELKWSPVTGKEQKRPPLTAFRFCEKVNPDGRCRNFVRRKSFGERYGWMLTSCKRLAMLVLAFIPAVFILSAAEVTIKPVTVWLVGVWFFVMGRICELAYPFDKEKKEKSNE